MNSILSTIIAIILLLGLIAFTIIAIFIKDIDRYLEELEMEDEGE